MTIREARAACGLSQRSAAAALGMDQPTYCRLEQGKPPWRKLLERVAASEAPAVLKDAVLAAGVPAPAPAYEA